jgi:hypothetical protein
MESPMHNLNADNRYTGGTNRIRSDNIEVIGVQKPKLPIQGMFDLRYSTNNPFIFKPDQSHENKYYNLDGKARPYNINSIDNYVHYDPEINQLDVEMNLIRKDEQEKLAIARTTRVSNFQEEVNKTISVDDDNLHNIDSIIEIAEDETIVNVLDIVEIEGLPSNTSEDNVIKGSIKVFVTKNKNTNKLLLHFSVVKGVASIKIAESFSFFELIEKLFCCMCRWDCTSCFGNCFNLSKSSHGGFSFDYESSVDYSNSYSTLPIENTVIDCMTRYY